MMAHGTGYRRNTSRRNPPSFARHRLASTQFPSSASLQQYEPPIFDQDGCGSCTACARARQIATAFAANGRPLPFVPSQSGLYRVTGCLERPDWTVPLQDNGRDPVDTLAAAQQFGIGPTGPMAPDGRYSDCDPATINDNPKLDELVNDAHVRLLGDYAITATGDARYALIASAIGNGKLPVCLDVSGGWSAFQNYSGGVLVADSTQPLDHYVCATGYRFDSTGRIQLDVANSWGIGWGEAGRIWLDQSFIDCAQDLIVCVAQEAT